MPGKQILKGVTLGVAPGEILCVMGMSGSGKTTVLHCIGGLTAPTSGEIRIGDAQIVGMRESALNRVRERMGMVFQYAALFDSLTVFENVAFGLRRRRKLPNDEIKKIVAEKLALVGLPGTEAMYPSQLSGGMAKRVGMARAIAMSPEILLYDEPTSGLDPVIASVADELIMQMRDKAGRHQHRRLAQPAEHLPHQRQDRHDPRRPGACNRHAARRSRRARTRSSASSSRAVRTARLMSRGDRANLAEPT